jgi:xanthine dehydrogenase YagS FAD-binding subunit
MINFEYIRATTPLAAVNAMAKTPSSMFIAGGTNLVDLMKRGVTAPQRLIDINGLPLKEIKENAGAISIGALAINSEMAMNPLIKTKLPLLSMALHAGASAQLRNMATLGGNMMQRTRCGYFYDTTMPCNKRNPGSGCGAIGGYNRMHAIFGASDSCIAVHPSDMCVALVALNTTVSIQGTKGVRKIPFTDFHRLPGNTPDKDNTLQKGELIIGVSIPANTFNKYYYLKLRDRASYAFALVSVAVALDVSADNTIKKASLAMGGVAHKPWRLTEAEKFLMGKKATSEIFQQAAAVAMKGAKGYGANNFKLKMAPSAIVEALTKAIS